MVKFENDWDEVLKGEFDKPYYTSLRDFLKREYKENIVYPNKLDVFMALRATPFSVVKVVILGQDPYHNVGQADGMSFSVNPGVPPPPSLLNIYKEVEKEYEVTMPRDYGYLQSWATQGVLLLNTVLTVRQNQPNSHKSAGWQEFTDNVISALNNRKQPVVFLLWGNNAKEKCKLITEARHLVLTAVHPSPLSASRGFFGCGHFKKANQFLQGQGVLPIDWQIKGH